VRKYLAIILGVLLILGFAVTASAADSEITLGGKIVMMGWYLDNVTMTPTGTPTVTLNLPQDSDSHAFYATEARINLDAKVGSNVRGYMELELSSPDYPGVAVWGNPSGEDTEVNGDLRFRQLWIQYTGSGLLGAASGIKVGHMPIAVGEKVWLNNERFGDDAIIAWVDPTKELHLAVALAKLQEGDILSHTDDVDGYVAIITYMLDKDNTVGINYTYINSDGNVPALGPAPNVADLTFHNIGIHANGKLTRQLTYAAEADFQFGSIDALGGGDSKPRGWAVMAKAGYDLDPVTIRASYAYGSGDDDATDNKLDEFQTLQGPDEVNFIARDVHYTQIYEHTIATAAHYANLTTTVGGNSRNTGIANTTYYNIGVDLDATKDLAFSVDGFYLQASETDSFGPNVDDSIGWELDGKITYNITKNLTYFVEAAGFWPGDFYNDVYSVDGNVTQLIHGLSLTF
jgi:hypothetical protein